MSEGSRRRVTYTQLETLWEFLNEHRGIATGHNKTSRARDTSKRLWQTITETLNAQGDGAIKDWKGWNKYWNDYKSKLKKTVASIRASQARTGGGPSEVTPLTEIEEKFLQILGESYGSGLPGARVEPFEQICNANMELTSVDASFGGATHDSFIWNAHPLKTYLEGLNETTWLLGDSRYPLRKYMMTPILDAEDGTPESHYTNIHARTRNVIERTIGLLKARFRCLLVHRVLHYRPEVAANIVNACVILHNICVKANLPAMQMENSDELQEGRWQFAAEGPRDLNQNYPDLQLGILTRQQLVQRLWAMRPH